ncbi:MULTISPECIES: PAS domain S-box protein [Methylotenera]|uniref:PAS domain S-box protein n=1 Tax=Methylotenera TaxID=359407 RepID=UPI0003795351|nr:MULTISPECIES: PAS domain S-box protein [Methylotenera]
MSLRFRLNLLITTLLLLFMLAVGYVILKGTKSSIQEGVEAATRVTVQLLDTVVVSSIQNPEWGYTHDVMRRFLEHLGHVRSNEIYLYSLNGALLFQSPPSKYRADITPPQWFENMLNPHEESVTRLIRFGKLIVNPNPAGAIREAWGKMRILFWVGLGFFIALNVIVYWMLGRWLQPLQPMLKAINRMEQGDLSARLPHFNLPEFGSIAQNFNLMGESLQKSTAENQRLALIAQQTADAMMIHDLNGNISFWNMAAQKIFGYAPQDIIGKSASTLIPKGQERDLIENRRAINDRQNVDNHDTQRLARDGRIIDVSISAAPLIDPVTNKVIGDISSMRDITERKQVEIAERKAAAAESKLEENRQVTHLIQKHIEDERRSLARELHDELGQYVTAIKTFAVAIANKTKEKAPEVEASAQTIVAAANHIYDGMHNIIRQLRPGSLDNLGLSETLKDAINNVQKQHAGIKIHLDLSGNLESLGESLNINIYRIVQESINNAIKHASAKNIDIKLAVNEKGELDLTIKDDGIGMDVDAVDQSNHFGLLGMRERVQGFKGSFTVDSEPNQTLTTKDSSKSLSGKKTSSKNPNAKKTGTAIYIHIPRTIEI